MRIVYDDMRLHALREKEKMAPRQLRLSGVPKIANLPTTTFNTEYRDTFTPVAITDAISHWPALHKWTLNWFKSTHGFAEVELSVNPTHTVRVKKMTLAAYIDWIVSGQRTGSGLYLDQYAIENLPSLLSDIERPIYCPSDEKVITNLWIGPNTTVLSFHKDNQTPENLINNIFVQIRGKKRIMLAAPSQDRYMYPRPREQGAYWHSQVDPENVDPVEFPLFFEADLKEVVLQPGDVLFIPGDYWHHVRALENSISLSFWWKVKKVIER